RLCIELREHLVPDLRIIGPSRDFNPLAQTGQGLQQVRTADDADHFAVFHDRNALDRVLLEQIRDLPERSVGGGGYHPARPHVRDLARMLPYEFHRQRPLPVKMTSHHGRRRPVPASTRRMRSPSLTIPSSSPFGATTGTPLIRAVSKM